MKSVDLNISPEALAPPAEPAMPAIAEALATPSKPSKAKKAAAPTEAPKREVVPFIVKAVVDQSKYERRSYMRNFHINEAEDVVRHVSAYGVDEALKKSLAYMKKVHKKSGQTMFKTGELIIGIKSYGPATGDCIRSAMTKLDKQGLVKKSTIEGEKSRAKYQFEYIPVAETEPAK